MAFPDSSKKAPNVFFKVIDGTGSPAPISSSGTSFGTIIVSPAPAPAPPPPPPPPVAQIEWWTKEGQTLEYNDISNNQIYVQEVDPLPPLNPLILFYKKDVVRASGGTGAVLTATANTDPTPPTVNWLPVDVDPQPIITVNNLPTGEWLISITNQTVPSGDESGGGLLQIIGPGTQILNVAIASTTYPGWNVGGTQTGIA